MSSFSVNTNVGALTALQQINRTNLELLETQNRVNTGLEVRGAKDNAGLFAIAQNLRADLRGFDAVHQSIDRATSTLDVALAAAESISDLLIEAQEKIVAASDEGIDEKSREALNTDFQAILAQIDTIAESAEFNGTRLVGKDPDNITAITDPTADPNRVVRIEGADLTTDGDLARAKGLNAVFGGVPTTAALDTTLFQSLRSGGLNDPATPEGQSLLASLDELETDDNNGQDAVKVDGNGNYYLDFSSIQPSDLASTQQRFELRFGDVTLASGDFNGGTATTQVVNTTLLGSLATAGANAVSSQNGQRLLAELNELEPANQNVIIENPDGTYSIDFSSLPETSLGGGGNTVRYQFTLGSTTFVSGTFTSGATGTTKATFRDAFTDFSGTSSQTVTFRSGGASATVVAGFRDSADDFSVVSGAQDVSYRTGLSTASQLTLFDIDLTDPGLREQAITVLNAYRDNVEDILIRFGAGANTLEAQRAFLTRISDTVSVGIGNLVDADLARESARLQALQVQQQLGVQALSIANGQPQIILSLFGG